MKLLLSSLLAITLCSCAPKLSDAQKSQINSIAIAPTPPAAQTYQAPSGGSDTARTAAAGAGVYGGAIGGLVGGLVGAAIHSTQNTAFKKAQGNYFSQVKSNTPSKIAGMLNKEVTRQVKQNPFFAPRLRSQSDYQIKSKILSHGLRRVGKDSSGQLLLSAVVSANVSLQNGKGKKLLNARNRLVGVSETRATIKDYAKSPSLLKKSYAEAIANIGVGAQKTFRKGNAK